MIDPKIIREEPDRVRAGLKARNSRLDLNLVIAADEARRKAQVTVDEMRAKKNAESERFGKLKRDGKADSDDARSLVAAMQQLDLGLTQATDALTAAETAHRALILGIPNLPDPLTPVGASSEDNVKVRTWGTPKSFDFKPKPHWEIGESLGILDFEGGARIAGARFTILKGAGARLNRALIQFMLDLHTTKHGYTEITPPNLSLPVSEEAAGHLPFIAEDMYHLPEDLYLIGTAEVPLLNMHREAVLDVAKLPMKYVAYTPCYRKEAGAAGKDTRGLIRQHQFEKVEMFQFVKPEDAAKTHDEMVGHAEAVLQALNLPYQLMALCTADISSAMTRTFDPEVWLPGQNEWREISSISNAGDFQSRRAQIRFKRDPKSKPELVHTLNGSGLAVGRTLVAVLENYQNADGSVTIPDILRPYMGGLSVITK